MKLRRATTAALAAALALGAATLAAPAAAARDGAPGHRPVHYAALGDSYSSGAGAGAYDEASGDCLRSAAAYPARWAEAHDPASFAYAACAGARTGDVLAEQLGVLDEDTTLVSVSIGGNDAGFGATLQACLVGGAETCTAAVAAANTYMDETLPGRLDEVYDGIRERAPRARVVVLGYPRLFESAEGCADPVPAAARTALDAAADHLNRVTARVAREHGFRFGDVRRTFAGHGICSADSWLHGLTAQPAESYHPTAEGQAGGYLPVLERLD
jgi:lysophospholipase L1-like esterase